MTKLWCEPSDISRRNAIQSLGAYTWLVATASILSPDIAHSIEDSSTVAAVETTDIATSVAARPTATPAESIRRAASKIPGFGPSDVLFPGFMLGKWYMTRDIVNSNDPRLKGMLLPFTIKYEIRFIPSLEPDYVVADRGFNQISFERALAKALRSSISDPIQELEWTETNPNNLILTMADGSRVDIKVTKRATEKSPDGLGISTSEFERYTTENARGIPTISARRVVSKWKVWSESNVDGIELVYDMGNLSGDPMLVTAIEDTPPRLISKARIHLDRSNEAPAEATA